MPRTRPAISRSALLALLALCLPAAPAWAAGPAGQRCIQPLASGSAALEANAQDAFREQRYAAAYGRYARLADAGHAPSAERALFMLLNGPALFASDWTATEKQQACWNALLVTRARYRLAMNSNPAGD